MNDLNSQGCRVWFMGKRQALQDVLFPGLQPRIFAWSRIISELASSSTLCSEITWNTYHWICWGISVWSNFILRLSSGMIMWCSFIFKSVLIIVILRWRVLITTWTSLWRIYILGETSWREILWSFYLLIAVCEIILGIVLTRRLERLTRVIIPLR